METAPGIVLGGLITIGVALFVEWVKRPRLAIELGEPAVDPRWEILHISVVNRPVAGLWGKMLLRSDARGCRVGLRFAPDEGAVPTSFLELKGRWSATPQPLSIVSTPQGLGAAFDINKLPQTERYDLQPDAAGEAIPIAIRHSGDQEAYAFNSESYLTWASSLDFRHVSFELPGTSCRVIVTASVGAIKPTTRSFNLICDSSQFALTAATEPS